MAESRSEDWGAVTRWRNNTCAPLRRQGQARCPTEIENTTMTIIRLVDESQSEPLARATPAGLATIRLVVVDE